MIELKINPFYMGTDKEAALKLLEEAAEAYGEWDGIDKCPGQCDGCRMRECCDRPDDFYDELADVVQAACNLAARYDIDLQDAMERCEERNRARGRYPVTVMSKQDCTDYSIRVWHDGDVGISSWPLGFVYAQINGMSGLQCNADEGTEEHKAVKSACMDVANAIRALNDTLMALEDE